MRRMNRYPENTGWIEVICGSMFSGKTEELISRLRRELYAKRKIQVFKPATDTRYATTAVVSHSENRLDCTPVHSAEELLAAVEEDTNAIGIDECQFFGDAIVDVVQLLADRGYRVICAGLDQDYLGKPFGPMPTLLAVAEYVTKKLAVCMKCGNPANRSQRLGAREELVLLGASDRYEARCRRCHRPVAIAAPMQPDLPIIESDCPSIPEQPNLPLGDAFPHSK